MTGESRSAPVVHPLLARRLSPTRFDDSPDVTDDEVEVLLEAARWAPSAGSQPWAFIVGRRGRRPQATCAPPRR
jgi:nitroreductase